MTTLSSDSVPSVGSASCDNSVRGRSGRPPLAASRPGRPPLSKRHGAGSSRSVVTDGGGAPRRHGRQAKAADFVSVPSAAHHLERLGSHSTIGTHGRSHHSLTAFGPERDPLLSARSLMSGSHSDTSSMDLLQRQSVLQLLKEREEEEVAAEWQMAPTEGAMSHVTWDNGQGKVVGVAILDHKTSTRIAQTSTTSYNQLMSVQPASSFMLPSTQTMLDKTRRGSIGRELLDASLLDGTLYTPRVAVAETDEGVDTERDDGSEMAATTGADDGELAQTVPPLHVGPLHRGISVGRHLSALP